MKEKQEYLPSLFACSCPDIVVSNPNIFRARWIHLDSQPNIDIGIILDVETFLILKIEFVNTSFGDI